MATVHQNTDDLPYRVTSVERIDGELTFTFAVLRWHPRTWLFYWRKIWQITGGDLLRHPAAFLYAVRKFLAFLFLGVLMVGCCGPANTGGSCHVPVHDPELPTPADVRAACERAGKRLADLKCAEARDDFADFCVYEMDHGVPIHPVCLTAVVTCGDLEACR